VVRRRMYEHFDRETGLKMRDPAKWRKTVAPYIEQDPERFAANECWVSDHSQLDFWCWFGNQLVRPWITTWQDWRTRKIMGHVVSVSPDGSTILASLRRAILDNPDAGLPKTAWIDNGKDYAGYIFHGQTKKERSKTFVEKGYVDETGFQGIYKMLGIKVHFSLPYTPNGKPRQESFYRPMHERYCKGWASYTGNTPERRPEVLSKILKTPGMVPDFDEVVDTMAQHIDGYNRNPEHTIDDLVDDDRARLTPAEALARWTTHFRGLADPAVLDLLLQRWHRPVTVGRNGVSIRIRGMTIRYGQLDAKLRKFKAGGEKVLVSYDPADVRSVLVYTQQMTLVGRAMSNKLGGLPGAIGEDRVKEMMREKRDYEKAMKVVNKRGPARRVASPEQNLALQAYRQPQAKPALLKGIQTPLDTPSNDPFKPDFKQAAGAETTSDSPDEGVGTDAVSRLKQTRERSRAKGTAGRIDSGGRIAVPKLNRPKRGADE
ncbi:MAG: transposase domain-containing protein, partial [Planctomycetota bacterium]